MRVADLMQTDVRTIAPDATVAEIVEALADSHVSGLPVVDSGGRVIGVVSATDVLQAEAEQGDTRSRVRLFEHTTARDLMTHNVYMIQPDADAREAAQQMLYGEVRRLFVEEKGRLVGVISQTDIAHAVGTGLM
jgi:CBS domain-containing protein